MAKRFCGRWCGKREASRAGQRGSRNMYEALGKPAARFNAVRRSAGAGQKREYICTDQLPDRAIAQLGLPALLFMQSPATMGGLRFRALCTIHAAASEGQPQVWQPVEPAKPLLQRCSSWRLRMRYAWMDNLGGERGEADDCVIREQFLHHRERI